MRPTSSHLLLCFFLLLGLGLGQAARADVTVAARQLALPGLAFDGFDARIGPDPAGGLHLQLQASRADIAALGWRRVGLRLEGRLWRDAQQRWLFDGRVRVAGAPGGAAEDAQLSGSINAAADTVQIQLHQDKAVASVWLPLDQPSHAQIRLQQLPALWLQGLLAQVWSGRLGAGRVDADLALDVRDGQLQSAGQFRLAGLGFDTPSGTLAAQALGGAGRFGLEQSEAGTRLNLQGRVNGGELLVGGLYARLPAHPVQWDLGAEFRRGAIMLDRLRIDDPDALQLEGSLALDARGTLQRLRLDRVHASFPAAYDRYGRAWLAAQGVRELHTTGHLSGSLDWRSGDVQAFAFATDGLDVTEPDGRFAVEGLRGALDWSAQGERPASTLAWQDLRFHRLALGPAQTRWQSFTGTLELQQPFAAPLFKGQLHVASLDWRPNAAKAQRLATSFAISGVDMASFSHALGWPAFPGTLAGAVPSLRWVGDRFELAGGLSINVFGGFVDVTGLSLQQPFGVAPVLTGDIRLSQLDLAAITSVFDFGNITGRLDGRIDDLRLVNWSPVMFKASLLAGGGGRISQRAVNNLTSVGGGGIAGGLQGAMLKLFKTFGYKRIGLNCTLQGAVCDMSGLASEGGGYTILEGSGLPHLEVVGHQTRVDWPTLVRRLREAVNGQAPVVH